MAHFNHLSIFNSSPFHSSTSFTISLLAVPFAQWPRSSSIPMPRNLSRSCPVRSRPIRILAVTTTTATTNHHHPAFG
jgi:hypothetical protein